MPAIIKVVDGRTVIKVGENTALASKYAALAEQFANAAGVSADAVEIAAAAVGVYTTVGDGESATTNGQSFYVASGGTVTLYINNAGTGDEVASLATGADVADRPTFTELASSAPGEGAELVGTESGLTVQDALDRSLVDVSGAPIGGVINEVGNANSSTATVGPDASVALQAEIDRAESLKIPTTELFSGDKSYSLVTSPLHLSTSGVTIRGNRGMTYSRGPGKQGAIILGSAVPFGFHVGEGITPAAPGDNRADAFTFENLGFMRDSTAPLKGQSGIYFDYQSNGPSRGVNLNGISTTQMRAGFEVAPPVASSSTLVANLTINGGCLSNGRYGVYASGPVYGFRMVGAQVEQNNAGSAPATAIDTLSVVSGGSGYSSDARVWLVPATPGNLGRGAVGLVTQSGGAITGIELLDDGHGYMQGETLAVISSSGSGATFTVDTLKAPAANQGGAVYGNIQGPIYVADSQLEGQPNPLTFMALGGPAGTTGAAFRAVITRNYAESVGVNNSQYFAKFYDIAPFHRNTVECGPQFTAPTTSPDDWLVISRSGLYEITMRDPYPVTYENFGGSVLRHSQIFSNEVDNFIVKGVSTRSSDRGMEIFLGDGFNRHDPIGGKLSAAAVGSGGTGYTNGATVSLEGPGGHGGGATATIAVTGGAITGFTIVNPGIGYTTGATLNVVGGSGTGGTATATASADPSLWTHSAAFTSGEQVHTGRGKLWVRDATTELIPMGFSVASGDLVAVTVYMSVSDLDANDFRLQTLTSAGGAATTQKVSQLANISRGDWVHVTYVFEAGNTTNHIRFVASGGGTVNARIAGICARNYGAYTNDGTVRQTITPVAPRLV